MNIFPPKMFHKTSLVAFAFIALSACNKSTTPTEVSSNESLVNEQNIKAHIEFLADDTLQGRDTGSVGYQISANYVKSYFKQLGLTPKGSNIVSLKALNNKYAFVNLILLMARQVPLFMV